MKETLDTRSCNNSVNCMNCYLFMHYGKNSHIQKNNCEFISVTPKYQEKLHIYNWLNFAQPKRSLSLWKKVIKKAWQSHRAQKNTEIKIIWSVQVYFVTHISTYQDITCNTLLQHHNDSAQYMTEAYNVCYFW